MSSRRKCRGKWQVRWRDPDGVERSRLCPTVATAKELQAEVDAEAALGRRWEPRGLRSQLGLRGEMTAFIADKGRVLQPGTVERYARALEMFTRMLGDLRTERISASGMSRDLLKEFWAWLRSPSTGLHGKQRSEDTARKNVEVIQIFWQWAFNDDATGRVPPLKDLEMPRGPQMTVVAPTWAEMDACIHACLGPDVTGRSRADNQTLYRLAMLLRFTGVRAQQAAMLRWESVDLLRGTIHITTGKSAQEKRGRIIPASPHLLREMATWGDRQGFVVPMQRSSGAGRERTARPRDMERAWERAALESGVRPGVFKGRPHHAFRKGFVSGLKRAGADSDATEYLVGHSLGLKGIYTDAESLPLVAAVAHVPPLTPASVTTSNSEFPTPNDEVPHADV